jgi:hypothetical protein
LHSLLISETFQSFQPLAGDASFRVEPGTRRPNLLHTIDVSDVQTLQLMQPAQLSEARIGDPRIHQEKLTWK